MGIKKTGPIKGLSNPGKGSGKNPKTFTREEPVPPRRLSNNNGIVQIPGTVRPHNPRINGSWKENLKNPVRWYLIVLLLSGCVFDKKERNDAGQTISSAQVPLANQRKIGPFCLLHH